MRALGACRRPRAGPDWSKESLCTMTTLFALAGGIGIFLLGMEMMTTALRGQAGPGLRGLLAR